ncbi:hypothetical protein [Rhizobium leguminosarum]|uniref:hypothetical protein n=1 Tax=Rhizobium leguminosarum TaxID=384 RepID=UPI001677BE7D|nr:hypothetical protein [Rhizobium leguminosarum]
MITVVSIALYAAAAFFAAGLGVTAEKFKFDRAAAGEAKSGIIIVLGAFSLAVILQVLG